FEFEFIDRGNVRKELIKSKRNKNDE
ncbi:hypothetical protein LCGC14_2403480, partial [marine sediment metagenome]